jgi:hypothetical protein
MSGLRRLRRSHSRRAYAAQEKATREIDARGARRFMIFAGVLAVVFAVLLIVVFAGLVAR